MRILYLGDIMGRPGRAAIKQLQSRFRETEGLDYLLANGENASGGVGLSAKNAKELLNAGIDGMTTGNHIWKFRDMYSFLRETDRVVRPANYPEDVAGRGWTVIRREGCEPVAIINVQGRVYMQGIDCPFRAVDRLLEEIPADVKIRLVDFHAEATSEKQAFGWHLDGRVSAVLGTHTHVQTNDARLLHEGTAYMTDLGMCGPIDSCLGMKSGPIVRKFLTGLPERFEVAGGPVVLQGALIEIEDTTGRALSISPWRHDVR